MVQVNKLDCVLAGQANYLLPWYAMFMVICLEQKIFQTTRHDLDLKFDMSQ